MVCLYTATQFHKQDPTSSRKLVSPKNALKLASGCGRNGCGEDWLQGTQLASGDAHWRVLGVREVGLVGGPLQRAAKVRSRCSAAAKVTLSSWKALTSHQSNNMSSSSTTNCPDLSSSTVEALKQKLWLSTELDSVYNTDNSVQ